MVLLHIIDGDAAPEDGPATERRRKANAAKRAKRRQSKDHPAPLEAVGDPEKRATSGSALEARSNARTPRATAVVASCTEVSRQSAIATVEQQPSALHSGALGLDSDSHARTPTGLTAPGTGVEPHSDQERLHATISSKGAPSATGPLGVASLAALVGATCRGKGTRAGTAVCIGTERKSARRHRNTAGTSGDGTVLTTNAHTTARKPKQSTSLNRSPPQKVDGNESKCAAVLASGTEGLAVQEHARHKHSQGVSLAQVEFRALPLDPSLCYHVQHRLGWQQPTRIQQRAIDALQSSVQRSSDRPTLPLWSIRAHTGTGKTAAYLLPIIHWMLQKHPRMERSYGTVAVVLAPTRELCVQIEDMARAFLRPYHWLVASAFVGGEKRKSEKARLRHGTNLVIGTPGRLWDHLQQTSSWHLEHCEWFILDEADRMLDLGMADTVRSVWTEVLQRHRSGNATRSATALNGTSVPVGPLRTVFVSATMRSEHVEKLCEICALDKLADGGNGPAATMQCIDDDDDDAAAASTTADTRHRAAVAVDAHAVHERTGHGDCEQAIERGDETRLLVHAASNLYSRARRSTQLDALPGDLSSSPILHCFRLVPTRYRLAELACVLHAFGNGVLQRALGPLLPCTDEFIRPESRKALVFASTCASVDFLYELFRQLGKRQETLLPEGQAEVSPPEPVLNSNGSAYSTGLHCQLFRIHGSMTQTERIRTFRAFRKMLSTPCLLFCTDVAARGLDIADLSLSVHYDPPTSDGDQEYWHRVGRTSRMGSVGASVVILQEHESGYLSWMASRYGFEWRSLPCLAQQVQARDGIRSMSGSREAGGAFGEAHHSVRAETYAAHQSFLQEIRYLVETVPSLEPLARKAFSSYVRSYRTHSRDMRHIFDARCLHLGHLADSFGLRVVPRCAGADHEPPLTRMPSRSTRALPRKRAPVSNALVERSAARQRRRPSDQLLSTTIDRRSEFMA